MALFYPCYFECSIDAGNGMYREVTSSDFYEYANKNCTEMLFFKSFFSKLTKSSYFPSINAFFLAFNHFFCLFFLFYRHIYITKRSIKNPGVQLPIKKEIYKPILEELEEYGVIFNEKEVPFTCYNPNNIVG